MNVIRLVRIAAASEAVALLFFAATHADRDAAALAVVSVIGLGPLALQCSLAAVSLVGLFAILLALIRRPTVRQPIAVPVAAVAILAALVSVGSAGSAVVAASSSADASTLRIGTKDTAFSAPVLVARAGQITVDMSNADLFWHTFTIDALGVDLRVPLAGRRSVTFTAAPGVYEYRCQIPGHAQLGMIGTLTIR